MSVRFGHWTPTEKDRLDGRMYALIGKLEASPLTRTAEIVAEADACMIDDRPEVALYGHALRLMEHADEAQDLARWSAAYLAACVARLLVARAYPEVLR